VGICKFFEFMFYNQQIKNLVLNFLFSVIGSEIEFELRLKFYFFMDYYDVFDIHPNNKINIT
jgi:hypothetical protein